MLDRSPNTSGSNSDNDPSYAHKEQNTAPQNAPTALEPVDTYKTYEDHGGPIDNTKAEELARLDYEHHKDLWWYRVRYICRDAFAEFCGTMIMIVFGDGSVAQVLLSANPNLPKGSQNKGDYQSISWGWGIGVSLFLDISLAFWSADSGRSCLESMFVVALVVICKCALISNILY